jgi:hypothetical protein
LPNFAELPYLVTLDISYNKYTGTMPTSIGSAGELGAGLQSLNVANNDLTGTLPSELSKLTSLSALDVHNNKLSGYLPSLSVSYVYADVSGSSQTFWCPIPGTYYDGAVCVCEPGSYCPSGFDSALYAEYSTVNCSYDCAKCGRGEHSWAACCWV